MLTAVALLVLGLVIIGLIIVANGYSWRRSSPSCPSTAPSCARDADAGDESAPPSR